MEKLRINDAIKFCNSKAIKADQILTKTALAMELYPKSQKAVAQVNLSGLINGARSTVSLDAIPKICDVCQVDANFLFGMPSVYDKEFEKI